MAHIGGLETYFVRLALELGACGIEQAVMCGGHDKTIQLPVKWLRLGADCISEVLHFAPDLIHVHNVFDLSLFDAFVSRVPLVFTAHGYQLLCPAQDFYQEWGRSACEREGGFACVAVTLRRKCVSLRPSYLRQFLELTRWAMRHRSEIAHVISPCRYVAERHRRAGYPAERISVLPYFCDMAPLDHPRPTPAQDSILFLGRIAPYKGVDYFVRILASLPRHVRGLVVGNFTDNTSTPVRQLARRLDVCQRLEIRPWASRQQVGKLFGEASVFVFPSVWHETLGIVGLEAMAHGVPTVAFDMGGARDWLVHGETGFRVPVKDVASAAEACRKIIDDRQLAESMGVASISRVRRDYSISGHITRLIGIYDGVLAARGG